MQVEINDDYRISTDPHNYILETKRIAGKKSAEPGRVMWDAVGFYSSLGGAINGCLSWSIKTEDLHKIFEQAGIPHEIAEKADVSEIRKFTEEKIKNLSDMLLKALGTQFLAVLNMLWMNHLEDIEAIMESVRIRAYGQRDPLVEYRRESKIFFDRIEVHFNEWVFGNVFRVRELTKEEADDRRKSIERSSPKFKDVGRNDPCPCGSGKKYKKCHGA